MSDYICARCGKDLKSNIYFGAWQTRINPCECIWEDHDVNHQDLLDDQRKLHALENAGVDNWSGYEYAMDEYNEED